MPKSYLPIEPTIQDAWMNAFARATQGVREWVDPRLTSPRLKELPPYAIIPSDQNYDPDPEAIVPGQKFWKGPPTNYEKFLRGVKRVKDFFDPGEDVTGLATPIGVVSGPVKAARKAVSKGVLDQNDKIKNLFRDLIKESRGFVTPEHGTAIEKVPEFKALVPNKFQQYLNDYGLYDHWMGPRLPIETPSKNLSSSILNLPYGSNIRLSRDFGRSERALGEILDKYDNLGNYILDARRRNKIIQELTKIDPKIYSDEVAFSRDLLHDLASRGTKIEELGQKLIAENTPSLNIKLRQPTIGRRGFLGTLGGALASGKMYEAPKVTEESQVLDLLRKLYGNQDFKYTKTPYVNYTDIVKGPEAKELEKLGYILEFPNDRDKIIEDLYNEIKTNKAFGHPELVPPAEEAIANLKRGAEIPISHKYSLTNPVNDYMYKPANSNDYTKGKLETILNDPQLTKKHREDIYYNTLEGIPIEDHTIISWRPILKLAQKLQEVRQSNIEGNLKRLRNKLDWIAMHNRISENKGQPFYGPNNYMENLKWFTEGKKQRQLTGNIY